MTSKLVRETKVITITEHLLKYDAFLIVFWKKTCLFISVGAAFRVDVVSVVYVDVRIRLGSVDGLQASEASVKRGVTDQLSGVQVTASDQFTLETVRGRFQKQSLG